MKDLFEGSFGLGPYEGLFKGSFGLGLYEGLFKGLFGFGPYEGLFKGSFDLGPQKYHKEIGFIDRIQQSIEQAMVLL